MPLNRAVVCFGFPQGGGGVFVLRIPLFRIHVRVMSESIGFVAGTAVGREVSWSRKGCCLKHSNSCLCGADIFPKPPYSQTLP